jgi:hypothetical protein
MTKARRTWRPSQIARRTGLSRVSHDAKEEGFGVNDWAVRLYLTYLMPAEVQRGEKEGDARQEFEFEWEED